MGAQFNIADLIDDLQPVRRLRFGIGMALPIIATIALVLLMLTQFQVRADLRTGDPNPMFFLRGGTLLLLALATTSAAIAMGRPAVGNANQGWLWVIAMALLFPATAVGLALLHRPMPPEIIAVTSGLECLRFSIGGGAIIGTTLVLWLRQGAPTSLERAGWLTGIASGGFGAFAYSLFCPFNSIFYIGLWYTLAVVLCAMIGRLIVPYLIRW